MTRYVEDPEWLNQINKLTCPYCEYSLHKPHQNKRSCQRCDFELYGDPRAAAYKIIESQIKPLNEDHCPECESKNLFFEKKERETVCQDCGLVVKGSQHYTGYERIRYPFGHHYETELRDGNDQIIVRIG